MLAAVLCSELAHTVTAPVTAEPPVLVGQRTGSRLFFPLLQVRRQRQCGMCGRSQIIALLAAG